MTFKDFPTAPDVPRLEEMVAFLGDHPELHRQQDYLAEGQCGTVGCLAGHTSLRYGKEFGYSVWVGNLSISLLPGASATRSTMHLLPSNLACAILGLSHDQGDVLFAGGNTRPMLALMVKDIANGTPLRTPLEYRQEIYGSEPNPYKAWTAERQAEYRASQ